MGQRANFVIKKDNQWNLYYDHWIANSIENELFWGPEYSTKFIQNMQLVEDKNDWLDEVWCEGGAVIDHDTNTLIWFGGENISYDVYLRKIFFKLLEHQWQGWNVNWAYRGIEDLGAYVGLNKTKFTTNYQPEEEHSFKYDDKYPEECDFLFSVENAIGTQVIKLRGDDQSILLGEKQLEDILFFNFSDSVEFEEIPTGGIHLIQETNKMYYWTCFTRVDFETRVIKSWPNWDCENISNNFEKHFEIIGDKVKGVPPDSQELINMVFENLERNCHKTQKNIVRELAPRLSDDVEINPWTDCTSTSLGSKQQKMAYLKKLKIKFKI